MAFSETAMASRESTGLGDERVNDQAGVPDTFLGGSRPGNDLEALATHSLAPESSSCGR